MYGVVPNGQEDVPMPMKSLATYALMFGVGYGISGPAFPQELHRAPRAQSGQYVPTGGGIIQFLFGGPRYYDRMLITMAAGACSYQRVGPDADALNKINDHQCGK